MSGWSRSVARRGKWSGRLTPRHLQKRLSRHAVRFMAGQEQRWSLSRLTQPEQDKVAATYVGWLKYFDTSAATAPAIRAMRAVIQQYGLHCETHSFRCHHGVCQVCSHDIDEPDDERRLYHGHAETVCE